MKEEFDFLGSCINYWAFMIIAFLLIGLGLISFFFGFINLSKQFLVIGVVGFAFAFILTFKISSLRKKINLKYALVDLIRAKNKRKGIVRGKRK